MPVRRAACADAHRRHATGRGVDSIPTAADTTAHLPGRHRDARRPDRAGRAAAERNVKDEPTFTTDFGQVYGAGRYSYAHDDHLAVVVFDARCDDGRIIPRRITITVGWPVEQAAKPARLEISMVLELEADGSFVVAR